ncbi:hypothetical protein HPNQ4076_0585 [Helicobacter pylori NQ4076]|uniref:Uncharacterized protein n=1 Tax=Helicobacter pylori NQ4076 TaxID=992029 RepID=J0J959_HELPX|nr:hypothetical protein HPNQ4076_0585 [Helicobacter pylori NQ4076]
MGDFKGGDYFKIPNYPLKVTTPLKFYKNIIKKLKNKLFSKKLKKF